MENSDKIAAALIFTVWVWSGIIRFAILAHCQTGNCTNWQMGIYELSQIFFGMGAVLFFLLFLILLGTLWVDFKEWVNKK